MVAPIEMTRHLRIAADAVVRNTSVPDVQHGIMCGEIRSSASYPVFKPFVYIAVAKAGYIDDGNPVFDEVRDKWCGAKR